MKPTAHEVVPEKSKEHRVEEHKELVDFMASPSEVKYDNRGVRNPANGITLIRLGIALIAISLVKHTIEISLVLFLIAVLLDKVDGVVARKLHCVTDLGKFMDTVVDKIVLGAFFICLLDLRVIGLSLVVAAIARDMIVQGFRCYAASRAIFVRTYGLSDTRYIIQIASIVTGLLSVSVWGENLVKRTELLSYLSVGLFVLGLGLGLSSLILILRNHQGEVMGTGIVGGKQIKKKKHRDTLPKPMS